MIHSVHIPLVAADIVRAMGDMRVWLDARRFEPYGFDQSCVRDGVSFRVDFKVASEAAAFAHAFAGRLRTR